MAFTCSVLHTRKWNSRLESDAPDPDWNDGLLALNPVVQGRFVGKHEQSGADITDGVCQTTSPVLRFRRVAHEGGKTFTYIYTAESVAVAGTNFRTVNGKYQKLKGDVPFDERDRHLPVADDDWVGERPIT